MEALKGLTPYVGALIFIFLPILFEDVVLEPTNVPRYLFAWLIIGGGTLYLLLKKSHPDFVDPRIIMLLFLFAGIHFVSVSWSLNVADSLFFSSKIVLGIGVYMLIANILSSDQGALQTKKVILISAIAFGVFSTIELVYNGVWGVEKNVIYNSAGHENLIASASFLFIVLSLSFLSDITDFWRLVLYLAVMLNVTVIGLSGTRSVIGASLLFIISLLILWLVRKWKSVKPILWVYVTLLVVAFGIGTKVNVLDNLGLFEANTLSSVNERYALWDNTYQLIEQHPLIGVGSGNWTYGYPQFGVEALERSVNYNIVFTRPHNDFLWVLSETGIIGIGILLLIALLFIRTQISGYVENGNLQKRILFAGFIGFSMIAMMSFPRERMLHIVLFAILLALISKEFGTNRKSGPLLSRLSVIIVLLTAVFSLTNGYHRFKGEYYTKAFLECQEKQDVEGAMYNSEKAKNFFYTCDPTGTPIDTYIAWGYDEITELIKLEKHSQRAYEIAPFNYKVLTNYGYALLRQFKQQSAETVLMESYRINPKYEATLVNLSSLEYNRGNFEKSMEWLSKIKDYELKYPSNVERINEHLVN